MVNRKWRSLGFHPLLGYSVVSVAFFALSLYLFAYTAYAPYIYFLVAISLLFKLSEPKRNDFLKSTFLTSSYYKVRVIENCTLVLPFVLFLAYQQQFLFIALFVCTAVILAFFKSSTTATYTLPTPFGRKPFEFIVGFRKTFYLLPFIYFLTYKAIEVSNFGLGIFSLLIAFCVILSYYLKPEKDYYVWTYALNPKLFLLKKIQTAILYSSLVILPISIFLGLFFPNQLEIVLGTHILIYINMVSIILAKYAAFPNEMNLTQGMVVTLGIVFPPVLLLTIPLFYSQAVQKLNNILA